jgi:hypothetical protein
MFRQVCLSLRNLVFVAAAVALAAGDAQAQTQSQTSTQVKTFEILSIDGNVTRATS